MVDLPRIQQSESFAPTLLFLHRPDDQRHANPMHLRTQPTHLKYWLLGILLVAFGMRLGAAATLNHLLTQQWQRDFLIEGDANGYWDLARHLARGEDYAIHTPPRYVLRMPGFPTLLAGSILIFGESLPAARFLLAGVGTVACWLVYLLGRQLFDERTGLLAAALASFSPVFIGFSVIVLSETAFAAAMLLSLIVGNHVRRMVIPPDRSPTDGTQLLRNGRLIPWSLFAGVCMALACYMRPSWILVAPGFALFLLITAPIRRTALAAGILVLSGMFIALLPWGLRNQEVSGHFTLTTFWLGPSLYDGLNPGATGDSDMRFFDKDRLSETLTEYEVDRHYREKAWDFVRQHPGRVVQLAVSKLWRYWKPWPNAAQFDSPAARLAVSIYFLPVLIFAIRGVLSCKNDIWAIVICAGPILYFAGLHMVFVSSLRYRLPAEYPLLVLAAVGIEATCRQWGRSRNERPSTVDP